MDEDLKSEIAEIISLVRTVPESLQLRAFEMLLEDLLDMLAENCVISAPRRRQGCIVRTAGT